MSTFSCFGLLAKVVGRIAAVILVYSNLRFDSETSPEMLSKVKDLNVHLCFPFVLGRSDSDRALGLGNPKLWARARTWWILGSGQAVLAENKP